MKKKGFTLIELMIVVAIVGILASVAIPSFLKFIKQSKATEAPINIRAITNGAVAWINDEHSDPNGNPMAKHFPGQSSPTAIPLIEAGGENSMNPADWPCGTLSVGSMYPKNTAQWNKQPWNSLKFSITKAHHYMYSYTVSTISTGIATYVEVTAASDFDCDSTYGIFNMMASLGASPDGEITLTEIQKGSGTASGGLDYGGDYLE